MTQKQTYRLHDLEKWDSEIDATVKKFNKQFRKYPNILLASNKTYRIIDNLVEREQGHPSKKIEISGFDTKDYSLKFCVDDKIPNGALSLVYDAEAEFI